MLYHHFKKPSFQGASLSFNYLVIAGSLLVLLLTLLSAAFFFTIQSKLQEREHSAILESTYLINKELTSSFDYVSQLMLFLGGEIARNNAAKNLEYIASLLRSRLINTHTARQQFSWAMFDWDTPEDLMVVSTAWGVMDKPISVAHRHYAKMAKLDPWKLHFDAPDIGISSGLWIIPAGMGVTDTKGKFLGTLSLGFNIEKFEQRIRQVIPGRSIRFIVVDENYNYVLGSYDGERDETKAKTISFEKQADTFDKRRDGFLATPLRYGNDVYTYYHKLENYPFTILLGYDEMIAAKELKDMLMPGIIGYTVIAGIALLLLFLLRKVVIIPIVKLSEAAHAISKGKPHGKMVRGGTNETNNLAFNLLKVKQLLAREERYKQRLKEALHIIRESDKEKAAFVRDMRKVLSIPLKAIVNGALIARQEKLGKLNIKTYGKYFDAIYDAGKQLESYTTEFLCPSQVNVKEIIEKCITIQRKYAAEHGIRITQDVEDNIPLIWGDKLRLHQVILSTLHQSLFYMPDNHNRATHITAKVTYHNEKKKKNPAWLCIAIKDNGFGIGEEVRQRLWQNLLQEKYSYSTDIEVGLDTYTISHLVELHHGTFSIDAHSGVGTTFTIRLPYLSKEDLDVHPSDLNKKPDNAGKKAEKAEEKEGNIISFPRAEG